MKFLQYLRTCSYWMFLLFGVVFMTLSLFNAKDPGTPYTILHFTTLYGSLLCLLLTVSFSITLSLNTHVADDSVPNTAWMTLGASLLVSAMIAAFLFFV